MEKTDYNVKPMPFRKIVFRIPKWVETLNNSHWLKQELFQGVREKMKDLHQIEDLSELSEDFPAAHVRKMKLVSQDPGKGSTVMQLEIEDSLYYQVLSEMTGMEITGEYQLISMIRELSERKQEYESVAQALSEVKQKGYGVITPARKEISIEEPAVIRQGNKYGVKIRACAPSIHLIRAEIETEIAPIIGNESQAQDLIQYMKQNETSENGVWDTLIFGKSMEQMVEEGIQSKLSVMNEETREKLQQTLKRIVNANGGKLFLMVLR